MRPGRLPPQYSFLAMTIGYGPKPWVPNRWQLWIFWPPKKNAWWEVTHHNFRCRVFLEEWKNMWMWNAISCGILCLGAQSRVNKKHPWLSAEFWHRIRWTLRNSIHLLPLLILLDPVTGSCWQVAVFHSVVGEAWQTDRWGSGTWPPVWPTASMFGDESCSNCSRPFPIPPFTIFWVKPCQNHFGRYITIDISKPYSTILGWVKPCQNPGFLDESP